MSRFVQIPNSDSLRDVVLAGALDTSYDSVRICDTCFSFLGREPYMRCNIHGNDFCMSCHSTLAEVDEVEHPMRKIKYVDGCVVYDVVLSGLWHQI